MNRNINKIMGLQFDEDTNFQPKEKKLYFEYKNTIWF